MVVRYYGVDNDSKCISITSNWINEAPSREELHALAHHFGWQSQDVIHLNRYHEERYQLTIGNNKQVMNDCLSNDNITDQHKSENQPSSQPPSQLSFQMPDDNLLHGHYTDSSDTDGEEVGSHNDSHNDSHSGSRVSSRANSLLQSHLDDAEHETTYLKHEKETSDEQLWIKVAAPHFTASQLTKLGSHFPDFDIDAELPRNDKRHRRNSSLTASPSANSLVTSPTSSSISSLANTTISHRCKICGEGFDVWTNIAAAKADFHGSFFCA